MSIRNEQKIFIAGPQGKLEARMSSMAVDPKSMVVGVVCHPHPLYQGSMDNKVVVTVVRAWERLGLTTVRFNFRGVGESEGYYDEGIGEVSDLEAVLLYIREKIPQAKICLAGFSFGAFISLKVAAHRRDLIGLISIAPALPFFDFSKLKKPACPWLIVAGEDDQIVPQETVKTWYQLLNQEQEKHSYWEFTLMPKADHFFHGLLVELSTEIEKFMGKWLSVSEGLTR